MVGSVQTISHKETGLYLNAWWSDRCTIVVEDVAPSLPHFGRMYARGLAVIYSSSPRGRPPWGDMESCAIWLLERLCISPPRFNFRSFALGPNAVSLEVLLG